MTESTLEQRVRRLEDLEAIRDLTARYAEAVNKGWNNKALNLKAVGNIFAADARWYSHEGTITEGLTAIIEELPRATSVVKFSMHAFLNPIIEIDGDNAAGNWLMWIASTIERPSAVYMSADMTYTRTDTGWRIQTVRIHYGSKL